MHGGLLIKEARLRAGLTQRELAERLGTRQPVVARWEALDRSPSMETVLKALQACGFDLEVHLTTRDDSDESLFPQHVAMNPYNRVQSLVNLLEFEAECHRAAPVPTRE